MRFKAPRTPRGYCQLKGVITIKTWGTLKSELLNLGFEKEAAYEKNKSRIIEASNRAIIDIAQYAPVVKKYTVTQTEKTVYDLTELIPDLLFPKDEVYISDSSDVASWQRISGERIEIDGEGSFDIYYAAVPTLITELTPDSEEIELSPQASNLIPLLAAFYVWIDDDAQKAYAYQNMYDSAKTALMQMQAQRDKQLKARVNLRFPRWL